jgi:hypothetical protein
VHLTDNFSASCTMPYFHHFLSDSLANNVSVPSANGILPTPGGASSAAASHAVNPSAAVVVVNQQRPNNNGKKKEYEN